MTDTDLDSICDRFDASWQEGKPLRIETLLTGSTEASRDELLRALLEIELEYRIRAGEAPTVEDYTARFPQQQSLLADALATAQRRVGASTQGVMSTSGPAKGSGREETGEIRRVIGPYKLLQQIGEGGMGTVYMAEQTKPVRRRVALKVVKSGLDRKEILSRFEAERQALAMMDHPNIAKVLDAGSTDDGRPYFVMELVHGIPITDYCDKQTLSLNDRLQLFTQACRAIQHAHQKGIIHRDVKPSNVLVTQHDGVPVVKVIDFGLAKALQNSQRLTDKTMFTEFGQVLGTLQYMSPEQSEMNALDIDTRSDVYSLGVLLYELLTGSTPITREKIKSEAFDRILALIRDEEATRPSQRLSESGDAITGISQQRKIEPRQLSLILKGDLDWIAVKSLEKDRNRRYDTPAALADDVQRYLDDEAIEARPPSFAYRVKKSFRKHQAKYLVAASTVILLVAGLIGTGTMWWQASIAEAKARKSEATAIEEAKNAREAEDQERLARNSAQKERDRAQAAEARSNYFLALARWDAGRVREAHEFLDKIPEKHRHFEWRLVKRQFLGSDFTCFGHTKSVNIVSFSPDGTRIASASSDGMIKFWDGSTGEQLGTIDGHRDGIHTLSFSPDGTRVASGGIRDETIKIWDASTGEELKALKGNRRGCLGVSFSPDGTRLASVGWDPTIKVWDASTGKEFKTLQGGRSSYSSVSFSPDGARLAAGGVMGFKLWDASTGKEIRTLKTLNRGNASDVSFSSDGTRLALVGTWDRTIDLCDASTGEYFKTLKGDSEVTCVSFSPDARRLASGSENGTIKLWDALSGNELGTLKGHSGAVSSVSFSPDGTRLASGSSDQTIKVWDTSTGEARRTLKGHTNSENGVSGVPFDIASFSPDGTRFASGGWDRTIKLWDVFSGEELLTFTGHDASVLSVCFSSDGAQIASGSFNQTILLWDTATGKQLRTLEGHGGVNSLGFSPDGTRLASSGQDGIKLWDASTGEELSTLLGDADRVSTESFLGTTVSFSPDGTRLASGSFDGTLKIWNASTGEELRSLKGSEGERGSCVSFSPDGTRLASGSFDGTLKIWNASTGDELIRLKGHIYPVFSVSFNRDSSRLASGGPDGITLWDASTGEERWSLARRVDHYVDCVRFSPDDTCLASIGQERNIELWDAPTGQEVRTLKGHTDRVTRVGFSEDGTRLYSQSDEEQLVWRTTTGKVIPDAAWDPPALTTNVNADGLRAIPSGVDILLVDQNFKNTPREKAYRAFKAKRKPWWHREQLAIAEESGDKYSATFHAAWLLKLEPQSQDAYVALHGNYEELAPEVAKLTAPVVAEALKLPRPITMSSEQSNQVGRRSESAPAPPALPAPPAPPAPQVAFDNPPAPPSPTPARDENAPPPPKKK